MSLVRINWKPDAIELRKFGAVLLVGFGVIGAILKYKQHHAAAEVCFWIAGIVGAVGLTGTIIALPFYWIWMGFAFVMGNIMSRLVLTVLYYFIVTPIGLLSRLVGRDLLSLKPDKSKNSYWIDVDSSKPTNYERQF